MLRLAWMAKLKTAWAHVPAESVGQARTLQAAFAASRQWAAVLQPSLTWMQRWARKWSRLQPESSPVWPVQLLVCLASTLQPLSLAWPQPVPLLFLTGRRLPLVSS